MDVPSRLEDIAKQIEKTHPEESRELKRIARWLRMDGIVRVPDPARRANCRRK